MIEHLKTSRVVISGHSQPVWVDVPDDLNLNIGDKCIIKLPHGYAVGSILEYVEQVPGSHYMCVRIATEEDLEKDNVNKQVATAICKLVTKIIAESKYSEAKLISAWFTLNRENLTIVIGSPTLIDLRKEFSTISAQYQTHISIKHVGHRDEAALIGGIGICGRKCCCSYMNAPYKWNATLCPNKKTSGVSVLGICGKTKCCQFYE